MAPLGGAAPLAGESGVSGAPVALRLSASSTSGNRFEYGVDVTSTVDQPVDVTVTLLLPEGAGAVPSRVASTMAPTTPPAGPGAAGAKPAGPSVAGPKPAGPSAAGPKPAAPNAAGAKPSAGAPVGPKPAGPSAAGAKPAAPNASGAKPGGGTPGGAKPAGPTAAGAKPAAPNAAGAKPAGPNPAASTAGAIPAAPNAAGAKPGAAAPGGAKPAGPTAAGANPAATNAAAPIAAAPNAAAPNAAAPKPAGTKPAAPKPAVTKPAAGASAGPIAAGPAAGGSKPGQPSASLPGGSRSLTWQARVAPRGSVTLRTGAVLAGAADRSVSSACVADRASGRVLDCAATVYAAPPAPPAPWWRGWGLLVLAGILAAGAVIAGVRWLRRNPHHVARLTSVSPTDRVKDLARAAQSAARRPRPRNDGYGWPAAGLAILALVVLAGVAAIVVVPRVQGVASQGSTADNSGEGHGWVGPRRVLQVGMPVSDDVVEFEVFRLGCTGQPPTTKAPNTPAPKTPASKSCSVTLAARNLTGTEQPWYAALQRLHVSDTSWVNPDPATTTSANGGADVFAAPLRPNERRVAVLAFVVPPGGTPSRLELREGAFARGVVLDVAG